MLAFPSLLFSSMVCGTIVLMNEFQTVLWVGSKCQNKMFSYHNIDFFLKLKLKITSLKIFLIYFLPSPLSKIIFVPANIPCMDFYLSICKCDWIYLLTCLSHSFCGHRALLLKYLKLSIRFNSPHFYSFQCSYLLHFEL